jgi:protein TonB
MGIAAAALVIVAVIGFPLRTYLAQQEIVPVVPEEQAAEAEPAAEEPKSAAPVAPTPVAAAPSVVAPVPQARALPAAAPSKPVPSKPVAKPVPARNARANTAPKPSAPAAIPAPAPVAPAAAPAAEPVAPEPAPAAAPAAPVGPFFELRDVNEPPKVVARVEPQVPGDLQGRGLNEVVIVRVLVSQSGQPTLVNLLRRSRAGSSLDNAVIAAVKQWSFSPARRRGETVSCWFHVGVPVQAD